jgi:hypothetical protein
VCVTGKKETGKKKVSIMFQTERKNVINFFHFCLLSCFYFHCSHYINKFLPKDVILTENNDEVRFCLRKDDRLGL